MGEWQRRLQGTAAHRQTEAGFSRSLAHLHGELLACAIVVQQQSEIRVICDGPTL